MEDELIFLGKEGVKQLWIFVKTQLAQKANFADLDDLITEDQFTEALATALSNYPTKSEVNSSLAAATKREVVDELPSVDDADPKAIYFVPSPGTPQENNIKDEYMLINGQWEMIGTTKVDLTGYWSKQELRAMTEEELTSILST